MASPALSNGTYVQYNPAPDSPRARPASPIEQTIGIIRGSFLQQGESYYQVVWNPGDAEPRVGMYHEDELTALTQKQAQDIMAQIQGGTYLPNEPAQGSAFQQHPLPLSAVPPQLQGNTVFPSQQQP